MEMGLATAERGSVYALYRPIVCLECGFAEGVVSEEALAKLRMEAAGGASEPRGKPGDHDRSV